MRLGNASCWTCLKLCDQGNQNIVSQASMLATLDQVKIVPVNPVVLEWLLHFSAFMLISSSLFLSSKFDAVDSKDS